MDYKKAIEVMNAIMVLAEFLEISAQEAATNIAFFNDERYKKLVEANRLYLEFGDMPIEERAKAMGYNPVVRDDGSVEITTEL